MPVTKPNGSAAKPSKTDKYRTQIETAYKKLGEARRNGDEIEAALAEDAVNDLLDRFGSLAWSLRGQW